MRVARGSTFTWSATITNGSAGLTDVTAMTLEVTGPGGIPPAGFPILLTDLVHDGLGVYHYDWAIPADAPTGTYVGDWIGIDSLGEMVEGQDSVDVVLPGSVEAPSPTAPDGLYETVGRFRRRKLVNLTGYSDFDIHNFLIDASAEADAYCNAPLLPYPHSFKGGSVVGEEHKWLFPPTATARGQRRVYPKHWPIREVTSLSIKVGFGTVAPLPTNALVVNNAERWVEVTALTISNTAGLFGVSGWVVPMGGLTVPVALIDYTYGWLLPVEDERLYAVDATNKVFEAAHGWWTGAVSVKVDGVAIDSSDYTVDADEGTVTFVSAQTGRVTASYTHRLVRDFARAVDLIGVHLIEQDRMRKRGMGGLSALRVNEISATRQGRMRGDNPSDLALWAPDAALLLAGYRYWSQA